MTRASGFSLKQRNGSQTPMVGEGDYFVKRGTLGTASGGRGTKGSETQSNGKGSLTRGWDQPSPVHPYAKGDISGKEQNGRRQPPAARRDLFEESRSGNEEFGPESQGNNTSFRPGWAGGIHGGIATPSDQTVTSTLLPNVFSNEDQPSSLATSEIYFFRGDDGTGTLWEGGERVNLPPRISSTPMLRRSLMEKFQEISTLRDKLRKTMLKGDVGGLLNQESVNFPVSRINSIFGNQYGTSSPSVISDDFNSLRPYRVVVTHPDVPQEAIDKLREMCTVSIIKPQDTWAKQKNKMCKANAILLVGNLVELDEEILSYLPLGTLKVVATMNPNYSHMDVVELSRRGVRIGTTRKITLDAISELAVGLAISIGYQFKNYSENIEYNINCNEPDCMVTKDLFGSVCGIVGQKEMVTAIASKLEKFGVQQILQCNPGEHKQKSVGFRKHKEPNIKDVENVNFVDLVEKSDFIFVVCPRFRETINLFNKDTFKKMKSSSVLVDVSAKGVVNSEDLLAALTSNKIWGAGMDVTSIDALPGDHPLLHLNNCIVTPGIANATKRSHLEMAKMTVDNILCGLRDQFMPSEVCFKIPGKIRRSDLSKKSKTTRYSLARKSGFIK